MASPRGSSASLTALPVELMLNISSNFTSAKDLDALARTCRGFYHHLNPLLYQRNIDQGQSSAVLWACEHGSIGTLERLHEQGADFGFLAKRPAHCGQTTVFAPIHVAAKHGHVDIVWWLLDHGAKLDALSQGYCDCPAFFPRLIRDPVQRAALPLTPLWSPLHTAVCYGNTEVAILFLERGASLIVSQREEDVHPRWLTSRRDYLVADVTVMHTAAAANNVAVIDFIVDRKLAGLSCVDTAGYSPLHYAATNAHTVGVLTRLLQMTDAWLPGPASPFSLALQHGAFACALTLLKAGHAPDDHDISVRTNLLHHAATRFPPLTWDSTFPVWLHQRDTFVRHLLAHNHPLTARAAWYNQTPLHAFASLPSAQTGPALFAALLAAGADPNALNAAGDTPLTILARSLNETSLPGQVEDASHAAAVAAIAETFSLFLDHGAKVCSFTAEALLVADRLAATPWRKGLAKDILARAVKENADLRAAAAVGAGGIVSF
ncbi:hypothetical protein NEMBOFW57_008514 [Staphylotrichum longicolle]|uniref:Uncharacterized protein n=1 Tax=Staphylotrichum longicolle TaxID=669026 RepID=A0AAD4EVR7_9PEZI|nr:hypothetical protein NEMBOFW57_008514 [Staphylotrichum longicolle]